MSRARKSNPEYRPCARRWQLRVPGRRAVRPAGSESMWACAVRTARPRSRTSTCSPNLRRITAPPPLWRAVGAAEGVIDVVMDNPYARRARWSRTRAKCGLLLAASAFTGRTRHANRFRACRPPDQAESAYNNVYFQTNWGGVIITGCRACGWSILLTSDDISRHTRVRRRR